MSIEAVIFDLGGTLIEYAGPFAAWPELETPGFMAAYNHLKQAGSAMPKFLQFREVGFEMLPVRWGMASAGERNLRLVDLLAEVLAACGVNEIPAERLTAAAKQYQSAVTEQAVVLPNAAETLAQLKRAGYKIGLVSNTMFSGAAHREDLDRFGLTGYFDTMLFSADANKWKPTADPFLQVLSELRAAPEASVYIGDAPDSDVVGSQRAGMRAIHIVSSQRAHQLNGIRPDAQIHDLAELPPLLASWAN